jgi:hypothetical protein
MEHVQATNKVYIDLIPAQLCLHCQSTFAFGGREREVETTNPGDGPS